MALHLLPDADLRTEIARFEQEEIRLVPSDQHSPPPLFREWDADAESQVITHAETGCQFRAYPVPRPRSDGLVPPFAPAYDIAVRLAGSADGHSIPDNWRELGRQGIEWILRYTCEAYRK
jgi:hypothetical protein